jgi:hypothetical protein
MLERCPKCGVKVWFTNDICPSCRSHCPTREAATSGEVGEERPTRETPNEYPLRKEGDCEWRGTSFRHWFYGVLCGGVAGLGFGSNLVLTFWTPGLHLPGSTVWVCLGIASLAGLILTPLFRSKHPVAVAIQGAVLGSAIGSIAATFPVALGVEYPRLIGFPSRSGPGTLPFVRFVVMALSGTAGGAVLGLIVWPKLKRLRKEYSR